MSNKRLYKSSVNCMLCGVCGGIAEYFDIDPTLVRLAWVVLTFFGGSGILAYIIAAIIIPKGWKLMRRLSVGGYNFPERCQYSI